MKRTYIFQDIYNCVILQLYLKLSNANSETLKIDQNIIIEFVYMKSKQQIPAKQVTRKCHSYTASENVIVAPRDGKFQTLYPTTVAKEIPCHGGLPPWFKEFFSMSWW